MVGASATGNRPSYFAMKYLLGKGFRVVPVNPGLAGQTLLGQKVYGSLADVPPPVHIVDIFRNSEAALAVTREAIALKDRLGIKVIWMQLGVRNDQAAREAEAAGLAVVMNRCPKIEYGRLSGEIGWAGVNTGLISSVRPKLAPRGVQSRLIGDKR
jgi:predicted CoA-binding protein